MNGWWGCAIRHAPQTSKNHVSIRFASVAAVVEPRLEECSACSRSRSVIRSAAAGRASSSLSFVRVKGPTAATAVPSVAFHTLWGGDGREWHTGHRCRRRTSGMYTQHVVWDSLSPGQVKLNH